MVTPHVAVTQEGHAGEEGLTCGLELELKLSDRKCVKSKTVLIKIVGQVFMNFFSRVRTFF